MEIKTSEYATYLNYPVEQIPREKLEEIISELSANAMFQMGSFLDDRILKQTVETIVAMLKDKFKNYELHIIATAFDQGSLGALGGTTAFKIRNVYSWLSSMKETRDKLAFDQWSKQEHLRKIKEENEWKNNHKGSAIYGTALSLKLSWVYQLRISADNWHAYSLDSIVELLRMGETVQTIKPEMIR